uniref:Uncharacterized protein n=1 Tax=Arundo donax TaxID=35708 RepID=A0A0A9ETS3_ARUDO
MAMRVVTIMHHDCGTSPRHRQERKHCGLPMRNAKGKMSSRMVG